MDVVAELDEELIVVRSPGKQQTSIVPQVEPRVERGTPGHIDHFVDSVYIVDTMAEPAYLGEFENLVLLSVLRLGAEANGVSVARELEAQAGRRVSRGALYTTLDRLEGKGLLRWKFAPGSAERASLPRRAYAVTPRGMAALRASHRTLQRMWRGLEDVLKERS